MRYAQGGPIRLTVTIRDVLGVLTNPSTVTLTVKKPDATTQAYSTPVNESTGIYHQDVPTTDLSLTGHYLYKWVSTGNGAGVNVGGFDVYDPFEVAIISLEDAKSALNIPTTVVTFDNEIANMVSSVQAQLESLTGGPIITRSVTERAVEATHFGLHLVLRYRPVVSVTSITDSLGTALSLTDVEIDNTGTMLERTTGLPFIGAAQAANVSGPEFDVVYTAGWGTSVPPAFNVAARMMIQDLWTTQRGPSAQPELGGGEKYRPFGWDFSMPVRALQILSPYMFEAHI